MKLILTSIFLLVIHTLLSQDYSKKYYASIHHYAERMLNAKIVENQEDISIRQGALYYYKEKNLETNYVHIAGGYSGDYRMCMWKMDNGNDLLGVTHFNCEAHCIYECSFFEFTPNDSTEISASIFPLKKMVKHMDKIKAKVLSHAGLKEGESQFKFILPRDQGIMTVEISLKNNEIEFPLLFLFWNGTTFEIVKKTKDIPSF